MKTRRGRAWGGLWVAVWLMALAGADVGAADAAAKGEAKASKAAGLPSAKEVIARFVKALGGREALLKHSSQHVKGTFAMTAQGIQGPMEVFSAKPNRMIIKVQIPGLGDVWTGYDGKVGWSMNPATGPSLTEGKQLDQLKEQADYGSVLHDEENYKSMEVVAKEDFDGKPCYKLKLIRHSGAETIEFYEIKTGLLVGAIAQQESPLGVITVTSTLGDYKSFGGALYATKTIQSMGAFAQTITIGSMEFGKVDDKEFELPEPIKALLKPAPEKK